MRKKLLLSRSGFEKPESREEAIMQNILGASNVLEPSESNIEEILKSILYNTPYTKEAEFEIEKILLAIKNNGTYDGECESRDLKILFAILNDLDYTEEAESRIEELFIEWLNQRSKVKVLEGVPPLTFVAKGEPLINYEISGNTIQSGTPTPDNPIIPQGTGERTGNLFDVNGDISYKNPNVSIIDDYINISVIGSSNTSYMYYSKEYPAGTYSISLTWDGGISPLRLLSKTKFDGSVYNSYYNGYYKDLVNNSQNLVTFSSDFNIGFVFAGTGGSSGTVKNIILNGGSTAKPYEPYGYKIPISLANAITPIYLGEGETTRRIKKSVLTGEEEWNDGTQNYYTTLPKNGIPYSQMYCSHNIYGACSVSDDGTYVWVEKDAFSDYTTIADWKSYLAAQYANGTPVTIWYVLAEPETAVINEPLMKIGDYADTLSMEQAGVQIPTVNGSNTLDVDTTVKLSNIYIEYK